MQDDDVDQRRRRVLAWAGRGMVMLSAPAFTACGGGGGEGGAGGGTPGTAITDAQRAATLSSVAGLVRELAAGGATFDSAALVRALQGLPAFAEVGVSAALGNVWAKFTDGQFLVVPNNLGAQTAASTAQPAAATPRRRALAGAPSGRRVAAAAGDLDTPAILTGRQFRSLDMFGAVPVNDSPDSAHLCFDQVDATTLPNLRRMAVGRGFTLPPIQAAEPTDVGIDNGIAGLQAVTGDGVLMITACAAQVGSDDTPRTVICSATGATEANLARYKTDLDTGLIVHAVAMRGVDGVWQPVPCLAITAGFAAQYWRFPAESIGIFNLTGGARLSDWIVTLNRAGLNHILGWEAAVPWPRLLAFADDLIQLNLATNNFDARRITQQKEPRLRAYGMGETLGYLEQRGIVGGGRPFYLQEPSPPRYVNTLLPTIDRVIFRENRLEFELVGQFGARADVDGVTTRIATSRSDASSFPEALLSRAADPPLGGGDNLPDPLWEGGLLQTTLRETDLDRGGYVQVFNGGRCSNVVPITHWEIPFHVVTTIATDAGELKRDLTVRVRLRADLRPWRLTPDGEPRVGEFFTSLSATVASAGSFVASGEISRSDPDTRTVTTITWSGSGSVGNVFGTFVVNFDGNLDWSTRRVSFTSLSATLGTHEQRKVVEQFDVNGELLRRDITVTQVDVAVTLAGAGPLGAFEPGFDDQWALLAGRFEMPPVTTDILPATPPLQLRSSVDWTAVQPDFPPRVDYGGT